MKIPSFLVVEDDEDDLFLAVRVIEKAEAAETIWKCRDGQEAMEFLSSSEENKACYGDLFPPSVILLDINMPRMNGFEFLQEWRRIGCPGVVMAMLTSSTDPRDITRGEELGVDLYLEKPLTGEGLQRIGQIWSEREAAS